MQAGQDTVLKFPKPTERPIYVNLKYFQDIEGKVELPRNFQPQRVKVLITTSGGGQPIEASLSGRRPRARRRVNRPGRQTLPGRL